MACDGARMRIALLHTAESNVGVFDAASAGLDVALAHHIRADLLAAAEAAGGLTDAVAEATAAALRALAVSSDMVVLTCSTLGPAVSLAETAAAFGGRVAALCAAQTTVAPTTALFEAAARRTSVPVRIDIRLVLGAWDLFKAGRTAAYHETPARAADAAFEAGADVVALAQASMAGAVPRARRGVPLGVPRAALEAAARSLR